MVLLLKLGAEEKGRACVLRYCPAMAEEVFWGVVWPGRNCGLPLLPVPQTEACLLLHKIVCISLQMVVELCEAACVVRLPVALWTWL